MTSDDEAWRNLSSIRGDMLACAGTFLRDADAIEALRATGVFADIESARSLDVFFVGVHTVGMLVQRLADVTGESVPDILQFIAGQPGPLEPDS